MSAKGASAPHHPPYLAQGPRVGIRHFTYEDADEFVSRARESRDLHRPWLFPPDTAEAYARYARARIDSPAAEPLLICEREAGGAIAGYLTISNIVRDGFLNGTLGYGAFAHAAGRGLMSEGLGLVLRHAFGPLGLHRLEANVQPLNHSSIALVRRAGFRLEGFSPAFLLVDGAWRDHERWAITSEKVMVDPP
ncbi:acetyltransferase [Streptomyces sp. CB03234]|uniref:GNAT family N-acetyltransferase n=1 Tax=Streptomyces sp. (strain CB03234) TaxID=1703937 RepID=UPI00093EFB0C|nr:GNAT family protein [Streptomyces sp. CB03234]OKK04386.1 acetyltransferase [Streptomyces sp. CB03234]